MLHFSVGDTAGSEEKTWLLPTGEGGGGGGTTLKKCASE